MLTAVHLHKAF